MIRVMNALIALMLEAVKVRNVDKFQRFYTALHCTRQPPSCDRKTKDEKQDQLRSPSLAAEDSSV